MAPLQAPFGVPMAEAAAWAQPPEDGNPPGDNGGDEGDEGEEEEGADSVQVFPDTTQFMPAEVGIKPARIDTTRVNRSAAGLPQSGLPAPGFIGPPAPGSAAEFPAKPARRGVFGLHPVVLVLGLVAAHVVLIKLVTH